MTDQIVLLLLGGYFIGVSLPGVIAKPIAFSTKAQLFYGVLLLVLALMNVSII